MTDIYQERYLKHRERKATMINGPNKAHSVASSKFPQQYLAAMAFRRSIRVFREEQVPKHILSQIFRIALLAPQSCNRQAITLQVMPGSKAGQYLKGGQGWAVKAPHIVLLFADLAAYKAPGEIAFMPWLDAGVMLAALTYAATACGVASCIINPSLREEYATEFQSRMNPRGRLFCGAMALGYAAIDAPMPDKKSLEEFVEVWE